MNLILKNWVKIIICSLPVYFGCKERIKNEYYDQILMPSISYCGITIGDTVVIPIDQDLSAVNLRLNSSNKINESTYLSFSDAVRPLVVILDFETRKIESKILFNQNGHNNIGKGEVSAFVKSKDSIFVTCDYRLFITDKQGSINSEINLLSAYYQNPNPTITAIPYFTPGMPPVFKSNKFFMAAFPDLSSANFEDLKKWPAIYSINLNKNSYQLKHHLSPIYWRKLYGGMFAISYYCFNESFLFSFPADKYIYKTNLADTVIGFSGKSKFLPDEISAATKMEISNAEKATKFYLSRDSYGPIYHDPYRNRYLRVAERALSNEQIIKKQWQKEKSLIIFDEHLQIIGETTIDKNVNLKTIFFTSEGIFARLDSKNEDNLYFVHLQYNDQRSL